MLQDLHAYTASNNLDLWITSVMDAANGVINDGVLIQNYYQGGDFVIERIAGSDAIPYYLNPQIIPFN